MNQFFQLNTERDYPLVAQPNLVAGFRELFADAVFRISIDAEIFAPGVGIFLDEVAVGPGFWNATFLVVGGPFNGWRFVSTNMSSDFERATLILQDPGFVNRPDKGYGWVVAGTNGGAVAGGGLNLEVVDSAIRNLEDNASLVIRAANAPCGADTTTSETPGTPEEVQYKGRSTVVIPGCVEIGIYPPSDPNAGDPLPQVRVLPDVEGESTTEVAVPITPENITAIADDVVTTITLTPVDITDTIPAGPGYDAEVIGGGPVPAGPEFFAGFNAIVGGDITTPEIEFTLALGRGDGFTCDPVPGCGVGVKASDVLKAVFGVHGQELEFVPGDGVDVLPSPGDHRIYFVFNSQRLTSVAT